MSNKQIEDRLLEFSLSDFKNYQELPFAVYITSEEGKILKFNAAAKQLFEIQDLNITEINIEDFYVRPAERKRFIERLKKEDNGYWEKNETLNFEINDNVLNLHFFCKTYKENGFFLGTLCLVFKITAFERFRELEENVPIGIFEISENNKITYGNEKFREILGINQTKNHIKESALDFFPTRESRTTYVDIIKELRLNKVVKDKLIDITKSDNTIMLGRLNISIDEVDTNDNIIKVKGFIEDVTFTDILEDVPIGLFSIKKIDNELKVSDCNNFFSEVFCKKKSYCLGKDFGLLIDNVIDYKRLYERISNLTDEEDLIKNFLISANTEKGIKGLIVHIKKLPNRNHITRYTGAIYYVPEGIESKLAEGTKNFASLLHSFSAMCNNIKDTLQSVIDAHGTEAVKNTMINIDYAYTQIKGHINGFKSCYDKYNLKAIERGQSEILHKNILEYIIKLGKLEISKVSVSTLRNAFIKIKKSIEEDGVFKKMPNELVKPMLNEITEIFRFARLLSLHYIEDEVYEMAIDIEEFKAALHSGSFKLAYTKFDIINPLKDAIHNLNELAERRNVEIKWRPSGKNSILIGDQRSLYFAFYNILNNAVKYSWIKPGDKKSWVKIESSENDDYVIYSFENRGVGILQTEIESGEIWEFGNRGLVSSDRKRKGTGIGLWHTKKIIEQFNGKINITSEAVDLNFPNDYNKPFITKITIKLPIYHDKG